MKVILLSKIKKLGEMGDVVFVADGYGKNYLLPKELGIPFSEKNFEIFKARKETIEKEDIANKEKAFEIQKKLEVKDIVIIENAGDNDKLYGSISTVRLAKIMSDLIGEELKKSDVVINTAIKTLGQFSVIVDLHPEVQFSKGIFVVRSMEEFKKLKEEKK